MATAIYLADPYTITFSSNAVTFTWGSGDYGPVTFEADSLEYNTNPNDVTLLTVSSACCEDSTTVRSTVATNGGGFATANLLSAYITANIVPGGTVVSITGGTGITVTPTPLTGTGTVTHANFGTAGTYAYPVSMTTNATGHVTTVTAGSASVIGVVSVAARTAGSTYRITTGSAAAQTIVYNVQSIGSWLNTGTGAFTVDTSGIYQVNIKVEIGGLVSGRLYTVQWYNNTTAATQMATSLMYMSPSGTYEYTAIWLSEIKAMTAGDVFIVRLVRENATTGAVEAFTTEMIPEQTPATLQQVSIIRWV